MGMNYKLFLVLGIVIVLVPFLGFPEFVGSVILFIVGVILIVFSLMHRKNHRTNHRRPTKVLEVEDDDDEVKQINIDAEEGQELEINISDIQSDEEKDKE